MLSIFELFEYLNAQTCNSVGCLQDVKDMESLVLGPEAGNRHSRYNVEAGKPYRRPQQPSQMTFAGQAPKSSCDSYLNQNRLVVRVPAFLRQALHVLAR